MADVVSSQVAAESGETDIVVDETTGYTDLDYLREILSATTDNGTTLENINTEVVSLQEDVEVLQSQLVETYKILCFIFLLIICYGIYKFFSGLFNTA